MKNTVVCLDKLGRVVLPAYIRKEIGAEAGSEFRISIEAGAIVLKMESRSNIFEKDGMLVFGELNASETTPIQVEDIEALVTNIREERNAEISSTSLASSAKKNSKRS